jgi:hypothetical protein
MPYQVKNPVSKFGFQISTCGATAWESAAGFAAGGEGGGALQVELS